MSDDGRTGDDKDVEAKDTGVQDNLEADVAAESDEVSDGAETPADGDVSPKERSRRSIGALVGSILMAVALLGSAGLASWLYVNEDRPDQETDPAEAKVALDAATSGTVALLSYSPDTLDQDFANAKAKLTGDFLSYYTQFTEQIVTPAARDNSVKAAASVVHAGVSEIEPNNAEVLVFIDQTTTSKKKPDGAYAASSVKVTLTKIDGKWLIKSFDPV